MGLLGTLAEAGKSVLNSDAGKMVTNAAADRLSSEINKYSSWTQGADTQSPTAKLQPPTQPAAAGQAASITDAAWFWPAVAAAVVAVVLIGMKLFGGKKRRK